MPGFVEGIEKVARDEHRHVAFAPGSCARWRARTSATRRGHLRLDVCLLHAAVEPARPCSSADGIQPLPDRVGVVDQAVVADVHAPGAKHSSDLVEHGQQRVRGEIGEDAGREDQIHRIVLELAKGEPVRDRTADVRARCEVPPGFRDHRPRYVGTGQLGHEGRPRASTLGRTRIRARGLGLPFRHYGAPDPRPCRNCSIRRRRRRRGRSGEHAHSGPAKPRRCRPRPTLGRPFSQGEPTREQAGAPDAARSRADAPRSSSRACPNPPARPSGAPRPTGPIAARPRSRAQTQTRGEA